MSALVSVRTTRSFNLFDTISDTISFGGLLVKSCHWHLHKGLGLLVNDQFVVG
jgi:hypothetical protein